MHETRGRADLYRFEMDDRQHRALLNAIAEAWQRELTPAEMAMRGDLQDPIAKSDNDSDLASLKMARLESNTAVYDDAAGSIVISDDAQTVNFQTYLSVAASVPGLRLT